MRHQLTELIAMHGYVRPYGTATEQAFIDRYIATLPGATRDPYGNYHVAVGESKTIFSSHTDTVARREGQQTTHVDRATGFLTLSKKAIASGARCLGSDDTVGVWLMRQMVLAGVPGLYLFHYGEEVGGIGSRALATHDPSLLLRYDRAIAFDRKGYTDVITHQGWQRCCSDDFAKALGAMLPGAYAPDDSGIYTDTAEYTDLIGECTNISVGYFKQHTALESLDTEFAMTLLDALIMADFESLPTVRLAGEEDIHGWNPCGWHTSSRTTWGPERTYVDMGAILEDDDLEFDDDADLPDGTFLDPTHAAVQAALRKLHVRTARKPTLAYSCPMDLYCQACGNVQTDDGLDVNMVCDDCGASIWWPTHSVSEDIR